MRMDLSKTKKCKQCKEVKDEKEFRSFYLKSQKKHYTRSECRDCEAKAQYSRFMASKGIDSITEHVMDDITEDEAFVPKYTLEDFAKALLKICRHLPKNVEKLTEEDFYYKTNSADVLADHGHTYAEIQAQAMFMLEEEGKLNPEGVSYGPGIYVIVGDSQGTHTKRRTFKLLRTLCDHIKPDRVFHLGHILDDSDKVSYLWDDFPELTVITKKEELRNVHKNTAYDIVQNYVTVGDYTVTNQDLIGDYVATQLTTLTPIMYPGKVICNLHRHEMQSRCSEEGQHSIIRTPGCLCEPYVIRTIKQIDFEDGYSVKEARSDSFQTYRRREAKALTDWEQGVCVVYVDDNNKSHVAQCRIKTTKDGEKVIAYFDKYVNSNGDILQIPKKEMSFLTSDDHIPKVNKNVLAAQNNITTTYKFNNYVDLGDLLDCSSWNHHIIDQGNLLEMMQVDALDDIIAARWYLKQREKWGKNRYILQANHERFILDFIKKYPQFIKLFDLKLFVGDKYEVIPHKECLRLGRTSLIHGDARMYNSSGDKYKKLAATYGINKKNALVTGHFHRPVIRMGVYSLGLSGEFEQGYNEHQVSAWHHGCAITSTYKDELAFVQMLDIEADGEVWDGKQVYKPSKKDLKALQQPEAKVKLDIEF